MQCKTIPSTIPGYLDFTIRGQARAVVRLIRSSVRRQAGLRSAPYWAGGHRPVRRCETNKAQTMNHTAQKSHNMGYKYPNIHASPLSYIQYNSHLGICLYWKFGAGKDARPVSQGHADQFIPVTTTGQTLPRSPSVERRDSSRNDQSPVPCKHLRVRDSHRTAVQMFHV